MWFFLALTAALFSAIYHLCTQNMRIDANLFMICRGLGVALIFLPFLLCQPMVFEHKFYLMALIQGIIVCYTDYLSFKVNRQCGAETVSSIIPFSVVITFLMWCFISPSSILRYTHQPLQLIGILLSFVGIIFALNNYYVVKLSKQALIALLPVLICISLVAVINKMMMNKSQNHILLCAVQAGFIESVMIGIVHSFLFMRKKGNFKKILDKKTVITASFLFLLPCCIILKKLAISYAENPAYVSCLAYTSILWVMFLGKHIPFFNFWNKEKQVAKKWKILFVASVVLLILSIN